MILYHISPRRNRESIWAMGLDPVYCMGSPAAVFLVPYCRVEWAVRHVAKRHGVSPADLDVWTVTRTIVTRSLPHGHARFSTSAVPSAALAVRRWNAGEWVKKEARANAE